MLLLVSVVLCSTIHLVYANNEWNNLPTILFKNFAGAVVDHLWNIPACWSSMLTKDCLSGFIDRMLDHCESFCEKQPSKRLIPKLSNNDPTKNNNNNETNCRQECVHLWVGYILMNLK